MSLTQMAASIDFGDATVFCTAVSTNTEQYMASAEGILRVDD
jgi:hypothetical protein